MLIEFFRGGCDQKSARWTQLIVHKVFHQIAMAHQPGRSRSRRQILNHARGVWPDCFATPQATSQQGRCKNQSKSIVALHRYVLHPPFSTAGRSADSECSASDSNGDPDHAPASENEAQIIGT